MKTIALFSAAVVTMLGLLLPAAPAYAIPRTFVSGTGSGATCSRAAPCATFQAAHDVTDAGGEINCLDAGNFGVIGTDGLVISKSITIDCAGTLGSISGFTQHGVVINTAGVVVRLRNLTIDATGADIGINFTNGAALFVESCVIKNAVNTPARGIQVNLSAASAKLFVSDSIFSRNGNSSAGAGLDASSPGGSLRMVIDRVRFEKNRLGIQAQSPGLGFAISVHIRDSVFADNTAAGFTAISGISPGTSGITSVTADRSSMTLNGGNGIFSSGANTFVIIGRSTVIGNVTGLQTVSGGQIFTYQNNHLTGNVTDGAPTGVLTVK